MPRKTAQTLVRRVAWIWVTLAPHVAAQTAAAPTDTQPPAAAAPSASASSSAPSPTATVPPGLPPPPPGYRYVPLQSMRAPAPQPTTESSWEDGDPVPYGYHVRESPRRGLVTAGYIVTAIPYGISAMTALSASFKNQSGYLLLPFVGPWMTLGRRSYGDCGNNADADGRLECLADVFVVMALISDGIMQVAGGTLLFTGYLATSRRLVKNDVSLSVKPLQLGTGYGIGASGTF